MKLEEFMRDEYALLDKVQGETQLATARSFLTEVLRSLAYRFRVPLLLLPGGLPPDTELNEAEMQSIQMFRQYVEERERLSWE